MSEKQNIIRTSVNIEADLLNTLRAYTPYNHRTSELIQEAVYKGLENFKDHQAEIKEYSKHRYNLNYVKTRIPLDETHYLLLKQTSNEMGIPQASIIGYLLHQYIEAEFAKEVVGHEDKKLTEMLDQQTLQHFRNKYLSDSR